ncbi:hypothetical protein CSB45_03410 [candidate division KSB3 bacterium]|uniref:Peptidase M50 domain-containing protein n=1 Tax=candidate division KSB3 bacterium TaxID=2044937 RepID=A0A2G6E969_9BACT|nr:MAG: hypothetical protein CSB45_03410 [candidate division KSB3 bacterium]PIE29543.1 MAG: hypothetical protein CSA57_08005 [candidate division KSB3 bacterium]
MNERLSSEPNPVTTFSDPVCKASADSSHRQSSQGRKIPFIHIILFLSTVCTTTIAGFFLRGTWATALAFSGTLLTILLFHEFGHYLMARKHHVNASLPYFIPGIPILVGTFGAVIKMRSAVRSKRALFDIGVAGPLAGVAIALPAIILGLMLSDFIPVPEETAPGGGPVSLGSSLIFSALSRLIAGATPPGYDLLLHPIAFAGWIGMLVTMLNLMPVGQLDGGHVTYAVLGPALHRKIASSVLPILLILGLLPIPQLMYYARFDTMPPEWMQFIGRFGWPGWLLWFAILRFLIGTAHPPTCDEHQALDPRRKIIGWIAVIIFILTFTPAPFGVL